MLKRPALGRRRYDLAVTPDPTATPAPASDAAPAVLAVALAYDELPPGSDVRREYGAGGELTITAPAGEPSEAARRAAAQSTGVSSAAFCAVGLAVLVWVALSTSDAVRRLGGGSRLTAVLLFGVVCCGIVLLVWKVSYDGRLGLLAEARRQSTVLHATPYRLLVETGGPFGEKSFDVAAGEVVALEVVGEPWAGDGGGAADSVPCLRVKLADGRVLRLMPGRHEAELRWVAAALGQALAKPVAAPSARPGRTLWRRGLW